MTNLSISGLKAADEVIADINANGVGRISTGRINLEVVRRRRRGSREFSDRYTVRAMLDRPTYGGIGKTYIRTSVGLRRTRNAAARCYLDASTELKMQIARELFYKEFGEWNEQLQNNEAFVEAVEKAEIESGHTQEYASMTADGLEYWRQWLKKNLPRFEV